MTGRNPTLYYQHMLDHAREAVSLVQGKNRADLNEDRLLNLALVRLLEIIGEAANRVPKEDQLKHSQIPWSQIVSLRNRLIHGYDSVDFDILWQIVTHDLPPLILVLEEMVS
jgi:uncharacterized protein with HEPN domain